MTRHTRWSLRRWSWRLRWWRFARRLLLELAVMDAESELGH